jgi:hypothetical protein
MENYSAQRKNKKIMKILLASLLLILAFQISFGQELKEGEYWDSWGEGRQWIWEYKNFTKDDVIKANRLFTSLKNSTPKNEWEGEYDGFAELGEDRLYWNSEIGFVRYHFYHTLRYLSYGEISIKDDSLTLIDKNLLNAKKNSVYVNKLIKVKFDDRHYLVPKNFLKGFLEMVVGVQTSDEAIYFSWLKIADTEKEYFGIPQVPSEYRHLLRSPIETEIVKVGKRRVNQEKINDHISDLEEVIYPITLGAGQNKKIKAGMKFFSEDLQEWIEVRKVFAKTSFARIGRDFFGDNVENCFGAEGEQVPCKKPKVGMKVITKRSEYLF